MKDQCLSCGDTIAGNDTYLCQDCENEQYTMLED